MNKKLINDELCHLQPQSIDLEESVLGSLLLEPTCYEQVSNVLSSEAFYKVTNGYIYEAIQMLHREKNPVDIMTVFEALKTKDRLEMVGGGHYLAMLTSRIASAANIEYHAAIVKQKYLLRELIKFSNEIAKESFLNNADPFSIINKIQNKTIELSQFDKNTIKHISELFPDIIAQMDINASGKMEITGIPSGFKDYDKHSLGHQKGDLIVIAGETSNGKTSIALNMTRHAAIQGYKIAVYSYEMSSRQLTSRLLAPGSGVGGKSILLEKLHPDKMGAVIDEMGELEQCGIFIDDLSSNDYDYLERSIRTLVMQNNIEMVVIDYLQLIKYNDSGMAKHERVAEISNQLKGVAKTLDIPIILISQLSRDRTNPIPSLARLKGSGDIENAADVIWLTMQPFLYKWETFECAGQDYPAFGNSLNIIAKGRNIGRTEFVLGFIEELTEFTNEIVSISPTSQTLGYSNNKH